MYKSTKGLLKSSLAWLLAIVVYSSVCAGQGKPKFIFYTPADAAKAANGFRNQIKTDQNNAGLWNSLALEFQYLDKNKDTVNAFQRAVELEPGNSGYFENFRFALSIKTDPDKAVSSASKTLTKNPDDVEALISRALAFYNKKDFISALADVESALSNDPKLTVAYALKSEILMRRFGDLKEKKPSDESLTYLRESIKTLEACIAVCELDKALLQIEVDNRNKFVSFYENWDGPFDSETTPGYVPSEVNSKSRPGYTNAARKLRISGIVHLLAIFNADGTIGPVIVLEGQGAGLTESAIKAMNKIQYKPAEKYGIPLTEIKTLKFNFTFY